MSENRSDIDINDPNFWQKWAKKADVDTDQDKVNTLSPFYTWTRICNMGMIYL